MELPFEGDLRNFVLEKCTAPHSCVIEPLFVHGGRVLAVVSSEIFLPVHGFMRSLLRSFVHFLGLLLSCELGARWPMFRQLVIVVVLVVFGWVRKFCNRCSLIFSSSSTQCPTQQRDYKQNDRDAQAETYTKTDF